MSDSYTAKSIDVLEGIEAVRKRPGMYIGGTGLDGLHHMLWELVDNAVDEAMNGHASRITVTLHKDGTTCSVEDNGRGIPVDEHPIRKVSALQLVLTTLHAGGKFNDHSYKASGGLHGVGSSAVNALSSHLEARIRRDGKEWVQEYRRGKPRYDVRPVGDTRLTGTRITFTPDASIFPDTSYDPERVKAQLEVKAYLNKGLRIVFKDQVQGATHDIQYDGGLSDYITTILHKRDLRQVTTPFQLERSDDKSGSKIELCLAWTDATREQVLTYVNGIPTQDGGTHEQGFRDGLVKALRSFISTHDLAPRGLTLTADDLREGVVAVVSLLVKEPQFQGQTKGRLNNPEVRGFVDTNFRPLLEQWLHENQSAGKSVVARAVQAGRARVAARQAANTVRKKASTSNRVNLPGKLADCSSNKPEECELFLVEGDSAGGSAKQGRDRRTQAILPLRGKSLNSERANLKKILANTELNAIVTALGCGLGRDFREDRLRYSRVVLLMDADSDGHHIATLLLTFFFRYLRPLIERGYVYLAQPPLYRVDVGKQTHWCLTDAERDQIITSLPARSKPEITRFKGLGEMPPKVLYETTLDPLRRRFLRVTLDEPLLADQTISDLMGKDPSMRYRFIMDQAELVDVLDV